MSRPVCPPAEKHRCIAAIFTWLLLTSGSFAASPPEPANKAPAMLAARLDPVWTSPLTKDPSKPTPWPKSGFVPDSWAEASGGALVLLGTMYSPGHAERLILHNAERVGPEAAVPLALPASEPPGLQRLPGLFFGHVAPNLDRGINSIAIGMDGAIWLGGGINSSLDIASGRHADAYLARLDATGRTIWQQAYSDGRALDISSIALTSTGGVIVAGSAFSTYVDTSWLARIGPDGVRLQEWRLGNNKGIAAVSLQDGRAIVVGFADSGVSAGAGPHREAALAAVKAGTYRDDVVAWTLDETGQLQEPTPIREGLSQHDLYRGPGGGAGSIAVTTAGNAAYVATNWLDFLRPAGVEVARIGPDGAVTWRQNLPETIMPENEKRAFSCRPSIAALPNGDALVACALDGQVQLHLLDGRTGKRRFARLPPPPCQQGGWGSSVSLIARQDGAVFVRGAGFANEGDMGCSWMAKLTFGAG